MNETFQEWIHDRPAYKTLKEWHPHLPEVIVEHHPKTKDDPSGFLSRVVTGAPGYGKSMYCYKIMAKTYFTYNGFSRVEEEEECYKFALDNLIYRPQQLFDKIKIQRKTHEPAIVWCIDDGSVHMGRALFDQDRKTYRRLQGTIPTVREDTTCLLISTPKTNLLAKPFREFIDNKVEIQLISEFKENRRIAKHYFKNMFPDDMRFRIQLPYSERFSNLVPQPFYGWYLEKKRKALDEYQAMCDKLGLLPVDTCEDDSEDKRE